MLEPYLVYLDENLQPNPDSAGNPHPKRILYVLSEDDLADAFFSLEYEQYEVGNRDPALSDYFNLPADVQADIFDRAQDYIERLFGSDDWSGALADAIQEVAIDQGVDQPGKLALAQGIPSEFQGSLESIELREESILYRFGEGHLG